MNDNKSKRLHYKECNFGPFLIRYWASGSDNTFVGIAKVPFKNYPSNWDEPFKTKKIYSTASEAEKIVLESTKKILKDWLDQNNISINDNQTK